MRRAITLLLLLLLPCASAQSGQDDPTLNESDFNSTVPEDDTSYLNETDGETGNGTGSGSDAGSGAEGQGPGAGGDAEADADPALSENDFDTSLPDEDTSYLDENEPPPAGGTVATSTPPAGG